MTNRLKALRKARKLTLDDISKKTGINRGTYNNYENEKTKPNKETWQALADFFNVPILYLQGAYLPYQLVKILQNEYKKEAEYERNKKGLFPFKTMYTKFIVENYFIACGVTPYNLKRDDLTLDDDKINDFSFWENTFNHFLNDDSNVALTWLLTKPELQATHEDVLNAWQGAIQIETTTLNQQTHLLDKRDEFIGKYSVVENGELLYGYTDWNQEPNDYKIKY